MRRLRELLVEVVMLVLTTCPSHLTAALVGDHVCHRVENYTVTSREQYVEPVEIHTLAWCLQIPPRCPQTRTELRERWRMKTEVKFKSVPVCCEGYVLQEPVGNASAEARCVPQCKDCRSGVCTAPSECTCDPGFQGRHCSDECPQGTWGQSCENECSCLREVACNPVSGKCLCPAGWTGPRCEMKCPEGQWGVGCNSVCLCDGPLAGCHHETGKCPVTGGGSGGSVDPFEASGIYVNLVPAAATAKTADTDYVDVIDFDREAILPRVTEHDAETAAVPSLPDEMIPVQPIALTTTTARTTTTTSGLGGEALATMRPPPLTHQATSPLSVYDDAAKSTTLLEGNQLSLPETSGAGGVKKTEFDFDDRHANFRVIVSPKTDYVKTTHKGAGGPLSSIPIDVAAMIVVGAIVSLGLTAVAALMIFHVRSRLLKAALSMYSQEKAERQFVPGDKDVIATGATLGPGKGLDVTIGTLPRGTMTRLNPVYNATSDSGGSTVLTFDERPAEYANGTVTIGIRLSSNLRDLLESHYDRPASCSHRSGVGMAPHAQDETDVEHVYDEIPLAAPFYFGKDT